jgi:hypothetical protein
MSTMDMGMSSGHYDTSSHYAPIKASPNASAGSMGSQYGQLSLVNAGAGGRDRFMTAAVAPETAELSREASPHDLPEVPTYNTTGARTFDVFAFVCDRCVNKNQKWDTRRRRRLQPTSARRRTRRTSTLQQVRSFVRYRFAFFS